MTIPDAAVAAVRAALTGWTGVKVYDSIITGDVPLQYVVVYPTSGELASVDLDCTYDSGRFTFQVTSVAAGTSRSLGQECRGLATRVRDALVGKVLAVEGWSCDPIEHDFSQSPQRDEDVLERPTVFAADGYTLDALRLT